MLNFMVYGSEECGIVTCYTSHGLYFMDWIEIMSSCLCISLLRHMALNKTAPYVRRRILKNEVRSITVSSVTVKTVKRMLAMDKRNMRGDECSPA
jgi:hypothetical protein